MDTNSVDIELLKRKIAESKEAFVTERTRQEVEFQKFHDGMKYISRDFFKDIEDLPEDFTLKAMVPEFYEDRPRQDVLNEQQDNAKEVFAKIEKVILDYLKVSAESLALGEVSMDVLNKKMTQIKEEFISLRTRQEEAFRNFNESLSKVDKSFFEGIENMPEDYTLKAMVPEYYELHPKQEVLNEQLEKASQFFSEVNSRIEKLIEDGSKLVEDYRLFAANN